MHAWSISTPAPVGVDSVDKFRSGFFARSKQLASRGDVRVLAAELRAELVKAGVPEDRFGYIVTKWVKGYVYFISKIERMFSKF